jgi:hypothetical protein
MKETPMETTRLPLDNLRVESLQATAHGKVPVILSLSAYDIPRAVKIERVASGMLSITFEYLDQEEPDNRVVDPDLTVIVGKKTEKVLGFMVNPTKTQPSDVSVRIVRGVDEQLRRATRENQRMNYRVIKDVVTDRLQLLLSTA